MSCARAAFVALVLAGCASAPHASPASAPASAPAPEGPSFDTHAPARIETETFLLELSADPTAQPTRIALTLEGRGGYHVNLDFPMRVELGASAAELEKASFAPADAIEWSAERARFETHARWRARGAQWIAARVQLAVCTEETCVPEQRELALQLSVP